MELRHNPFAGALEKLKITKQLNADNLEKENKEKDAFQAQEIEKNSINNEKLNNTDKKSKEEKEDETIFKSLTQIFGITERQSPKKYWAILRAIRNSRETDVSYEINRWLDYDLKTLHDPKAKEIINMILKRGYESGSKGWLESATAEGMKYGNGTKEVRLVEAEKLAKKAGMSLSEVKEKYKIVL